MHEYSLVLALIDQVERVARARGASAVHRVAVRIEKHREVAREPLLAARESDARTGLGREPRERRRQISP